MPIHLDGSSKILMVTEHKMKIVLASASPRRSEILKQVGFDFTVRISSYDEDMSLNLIPEELVKTLAKNKASHTEIYDDEVLIACDTVVSLDKVMGKPKDENDAFDMLKNLSGKVHSVFSGVCLKSKTKEEVFAVETKIEFYQISDKEIKDYIKTGEPMDKAGSYAVQGLGALFVKKIDGDYFNVVGLPIASLAKKLKEF